MKYGRLGERERHVHRLLDEDDRRALRRAMLADDLGSSCSTTTGASPSDSSSIISSSGSDRNAMPEREHLLLAARQVGGRLVEALGAGPGTARATRSTPRRAPCLVARGAATRRRGGSRATVSDGNTPGRRAPARCRARRSRAGGAWVMSRPSKMIAPWSASTTPEMALSSVDLPAPLVPSSATISPSSTSKSTSNSTCTRRSDTSRSRTQQQLRLALAALVQRPRSGPRRPSTPR